MFLLSTQQATQFLRGECIIVWSVLSVFVPTDIPDTDALLDLGAGDGAITASISKALNCKKVYATEASTPMQYRLRVCDLELTV